MDSGIPKSSCPDSQDSRVVQTIYTGAYPGKASVNSRACSCLRMGPLCLGVWKNKEAPLPWVNSAELWRFEH